MIVFKTHSIFMFAIVFFLNKDIHAELTPEKKQEIDTLRGTCESTINHTFPGENVREHVTLVMKSFTIDDFTENEDESPFYSYYGALSANLKGGHVPPYNTFCEGYNQIIAAAICRGSIMNFFGDNPNVVVIDAYFGLNNTIVQEYDNSFREQLIVAMPEAFPSKELVPNIIMDYWKLITEKFEIDVGDLIAYEDVLEGEEHMLPPKLFCESRHPYPN